MAAVTSLASLTLNPVLPLCFCWIPVTARLPVVMVIASSKGINFSKVSLFHVFPSRLPFVNKTEALMATLTCLTSSPWCPVEFTLPLNFVRCSTPHKAALQKYQEQTYPALWPRAGARTRRIWRDRVSTPTRGEAAARSFARLKEGSPAAGALQLCSVVVLWPWPPSL